MTLLTTNRKRILVVDDIPDNLALARAVLEDEGYDVDVVDNGQAALQQVEQSPPDLILLDVMMPGMDGYEVTRRIRQTDRPFIPILLITAHEQSDLVVGLDAGADEFVRKPFNLDELLARVRSLLRLKQSIDEQAEMTRQREDFVARLTHDLRTPLVAADRMYQLFLQNAFGALSQDMQEALTTMIRSNQNLLQMVNTLLEVYRYDAGQKKLTLVSCPVCDLIQEVAQELEPLATEKGLALTVYSHPLPAEVSDGSACRVLGDRLELRRVLTNLIGNAIKFTDQGTIHVRVIKASAAAQTPNQTENWLRIEVTDTGSGISPDDLKLLFERFRPGRHKRSGSGLGLHLTRRIVEAHQGQINVKSELKKGSVFTVSLPIHP